jgi:uncharacterized protein
MKSVFADTGFWIAIINPRDQWHLEASNISESLYFRQVRIYTSEMVLTELLNFFCAFPSFIRKQAAIKVQEIKQSQNLTVIPQNSKQFDLALQLYLLREDKEWSSFLLMEELKITVALSHDKHFIQAGFQNLIK